LWNFALTTVAGTGETGFNREEEETATKVMLHEPWAMFFDDEIREFSTSVTDSMPASGQFTWRAHEWR
jgi:hypothetical protein